jgi:hypothetical protein
VRERHESRHLAVGAGSPSDPDPADPADPADEIVDEPSESGSNGHDATEAAGTRTTDDVVQAVAEFLDDLVDDPTFANDPVPPDQ